MYVCMYICTYVRMYVCTYVCMYVCMYVHNAYVPVANGPIMLCICVCIFLKEWHKVSRDYSTILG